MRGKRRSLKSIPISILSFIALSMSNGYVFADENEPISFIGHGGFFNSEGRQIEVTQDLVGEKQKFYRQRLI